MATAIKIAGSTERAGGLDSTGETQIVSPGYGSKVLIRAHWHGKTLRVEVLGEVDPSSAPAFHRALEAACSSPALQPMDSDEQPLSRSVLVDLRQLAFIDSAGLAVLLTLRAQFLDHCRLTLLVKPATQPERVLRLSQFGRIFPIAESLEAFEAATE